MNKMLLCLLLVGVNTSSVRAEGCAVPTGFEAVLPAVKVPIDAAIWQTKKPLRAVTLVNLWAVWCPPCVKELPMLDKLAKQDAFTVATIHLGDNPDAIAQRFKQLNITALASTIEPDFSQLQHWGFQGMPASMILINDELKYRYSGYIKTPPQALTDWLTCLAKEHN